MKDPDVPILPRNSYARSSTPLAVCWNMVLWLTFRVRAISFWDSPALRRPIALFRVAGSNLGMVAYQLGNTSVFFIFKVVTIAFKTNKINFGLIIKFSIISCS